MLRAGTTSLSRPLSGLLRCIRIREEVEDVLGPQAARGMSDQICLPQIIEFHALFWVESPLRLCAMSYSR